MMATLVRLRPAESATAIIQHIKERTFLLKGNWVYNSPTSGLVPLGQDALNRIDAFI